MDLTARFSRLPNYKVEPFYPGKSNDTEIIISKPEPKLSKKGPVSKITNGTKSLKKKYITKYQQKESLHHYEYPIWKGIDGHYQNSMYGCEGHPYMYSPIHPLIPFHAPPALPNYQDKIYKSQNLNASSQSTMASDADLDQSSSDSNGFKIVLEGSVIHEGCCSESDNEISNYWKKYFSFYIKERESSPFVVFEPKSDSISLPSFLV